MINIPHGKFLGKEVKTPDGIGLLVSINTPFNGLYIEPERATYVVWYGIQEPYACSGKWVSFTYTSNEIKGLEEDN